MNIEVNKIITLGNNEKYLVISHITNDIKDNYKIMLKTEENGKIFLDEVFGEANLKTVLPLFVKDMA